MGEESIRHNRLPVNFHQTFMPERYYINALLRFVAADKSGTFQDISAETGIPVGHSSGKVPAIINYCIGMGLIKRSDEQQEKIKHFSLTPFGRIVFLEDPYLKESVTQWIAHLNLCDPFKGADVWYQVFIKGYYDLGLKFSREYLEEFLKLIYGPKRKSLIGPLIRMYQDDASFGTCQALQEINGNINRNAAPIDEEFGFAYGAWLLEAINNHFPESYQISLSELDEIAGWSTISNWNFSDIKHVLNNVERKGVIEIDRHMDPWLLKPRLNSSKAWQTIFDDLI